MESVLRFFKMTLIGGVIFLVPIIVLIVVIGKALVIAKNLVKPLAGWLPVNSVGGIEIAGLLAIVAIVLFCFMAGLFAKTRVAERMVGWLESTLLSKVPGYSLIKSMGETMVGVEKSGIHEAVLAQYGNLWVIAFLIERIEGGHVAVFVPGSPNPWSGGAVYIMTEDQIKPLDIRLPAALACVERLGVGSNALLRGRL